MFQICQKKTMGQSVKVQVRFIVKIDPNFFQQKFL